MDLKSIWIMDLWSQKTCKNSSKTWQPSMTSKLSCGTSLRKLEIPWKPSRDPHLRWDLYLIAFRRTPSLNCCRGLISEWEKFTRFRDLNFVLDQVIIERGCIDLADKTSIFWGHPKVARVLQRFLLSHIIINSLYVTQSYIRLLVAKFVHF